MKKVLVSMFGLALAASALLGTGTGKVQAAGENPYNAFNWYYVTDGTIISKKYSKTHKGMDIAVNKETVYSCECQSKC
ncbi:hypothetical protein [uncultured Brevibacillus sp.]|uniref:hypothetical protein n=1 Tax=uncultured Brevibacillus sp. TaxID=169970 RepID=UPI0025926372|nr:hypothetical protein [uncultured Brevibacillus sp.]